ncbi:MAG: hypothetical protein ACR2J8_14755 [Thermomicrobiales bacterium]
MTEPSEPQQPEGTTSTVAAFASEEVAPAAAEPTVGTGTIMAVGCLALIVLAVIVLALTRFVPFFSR